MNIDKIIKEEVRILNEVSLDVNKLGHALANVESYGGDYTATNPKSSAAGKYQFLWNTWGKEIERVTGFQKRDGPPAATHLEVVKKKKKKVTTTTTTTGWPRPQLLAVEINNAYIVLSH